MWTFIIILLCILLIVGIIGLVWSNNDSKNYNTDDNVYT